jgi:hypothetical protein
MDMDTDERYLVAPASTRPVQLKTSFMNEEKPLSVRHHITKVSAAPQPLSSLSSSGLKHASKAVRTEASTFIEQQRKVLSPRVGAEHTAITQTNQSDLNMTKISSFFANNGTNVSQASVKGQTRNKGSLIPSKSYTHQWVTIQERYES